MIAFVESFLDFLLAPVGAVYDFLWHKLGIRWKPAIATLWTTALVVLLSSRVILLWLTPAVQHPYLFGWSLIITLLVGQIVGLIAADLWRFRVGGNAYFDSYDNPEKPGGNNEKCFAVLLLATCLIVALPLIWLFVPASCLVAGISNPEGTLSIVYLALSRLAALLLFLGLVSFSYPAGNQK